MIRWDELCTYCPLYTYCVDTLGEAREYDLASWESVRRTLIAGLNELREEDGHGKVDGGA